MTMEEGEGAPAAVLSGMLSPFIAHHTPCRIAAGVR
jgi:hypothetical protein